MGGATAGGQLIVLVALPILTRLYSPKEFGASAAFVAVVGLITVVAALRYEIAIPLPRRDRAAFQLLFLALVIVTAVAVLSGLGWLVAGRWFDVNTGLSSECFAALVAIGVFTAGVYQVLSYWLTRRSKFGAVALTRIQQGVAGNGTQIGFGLAGAGVIGLIVGQIVGQCAGILRLAAETLADYRRSGAYIRPQGVKWAAKRYRHFALFDTWAALLNVAGTQAPVLLFALFSPVLAGYYALAYRVLSAPIGLIGKAISNPLLPRLVEARRDGNAAALVKMLLGILAMLALPPFAIAAAVAPDIVPIIFGREWAPAVIVIVWTATWVGWQFITSPLSVALIALEGQRLNAVLQLALVVVRISALLGGAAAGSTDLALAGFSISSAIGYAVYTVATGKAVGLPMVDMLGAVYKPLLMAAVGLGVAFALPADMVLVRYSVVLCLMICWLIACWTGVRGGLFDRRSASATSPPH
ncbi:hypothetical protein EAH87_17750 [Sphingomonas koreensis]|nr:hypothetical protein EAH87_17750 [Sphingomonas koreensis]